jgi:transcriptional regulator with XRE-family HTH domain
MDDPRIGRRFRALRQRLGWRQADLGARAGVAQDTVSRVERGRFGAMPIGRLRAVARALDAEVVLSLRWRGGDLDRLVDEGHAALVGHVIRWLTALGWEVQPEVTFAVYAERGSIDVLAWNRASRTLLVIEVKTELVSVEETLRRHDVKVRLAARIAAERFGWQPIAVGRLLVLPDTSVARRRVARHESVLTGAYPARQETVRRWLRAPTGPIAGLAFVSDRTAVLSVGRKRVRPLTAARERSQADRNDRR